MTLSRDIPSDDEVRSYLVDRSNAGRWGADDQRGTLNLVTDAARLTATDSVRTGQTISLSRPLPTWGGPGNPNPAQHYMKMEDGWATDYYGIEYHGVNTTHIDALSHMWDDGGIYNGRDPKDTITFEGATFGGVEQWAEGIVTRAVILDVPRFRGVPFVEFDEPVHGWELEQILEDRGVSLNPGDAVCVYSGREAWQRANPDKPYGRYPIEPRPGVKGRWQKPGLHASCLPFLRDNDVSALLWDMLDVTPHGYRVPWTIHAAIYAYGLALIDNALLEPIATACHEQDRDDFMLVVAPLVVNGGTGSPVNPLAIL